MDSFLIGVGAQKSATSWLADCLKKHPDIHMFPWKEAHYWDAIALPNRNGVVKMIDERIRDGRRSLRAKISISLRMGRHATRNRALHLQRALALRDEPDYYKYRELLMIGYRGQQVVGEFTPAYAMLDRTMFRKMRCVHPNTKFVFLMRDPVSRHISSVKQLHADKEILKLDGGKATDRAFRSRCLLLAREKTSAIYRRGDYKRTIEELEAAVEPASIFYGFYETIMSQSEMRRLARFVGVSGFSGDARQRVNAAKMSFSAEEEAFLASLTEALGGVYDFVRARFGSQVPPSWRKSPLAGSRDRPGRV